MIPVLSSIDDHRTEHIHKIDAILASEKDGRIYRTSETQDIDFKEEAGRRHGSMIEPGQSQNPGAANKLADEVACMANSPGGGALILGIADKTGEIIGTELDIDWLRQAIYTRVDVAPDITERELAGQRILIILVAPAVEPVEDTSGRLRWRVGDSCRPVDRAEWWQYQRRIHNFDPMAQSSEADLSSVRGPALSFIRKQNESFQEKTDEELLRAVGALDSEGRLSLAGKMLFSSLGISAMELSIFDVYGGYVLNRITSSPDKSCLEQLEEIELALRVMNKNSTVVEGLAHRPIAEIPHMAVREALLNAMIHRDWNRSEPIEVRWIQVDSTLIVRSPGAFLPAINSSNVLSNRAARYPALADLYRAIGLVDKQGVGVDRMYQSMIVLGHRPPTIKEVAGPYVETTLVGGPPVLSIVRLVSEIIPSIRQRDYRIAIVLYHLFHHAFITVSSLAKALQSDEESAQRALEAAQQTTVQGEPLIHDHKTVWVLGNTVREILKSSTSSPHSPGNYLSTDRMEIERVVKEWLEEVGSIATSDLIALTGVSRGTATACIRDMVERDIVESFGGGRSQQYRLRK